ncbi:MAG: DUF2125 domain-containing protein [Sulfitobacter sp.]|nr:DUF2125 domain-containing protein [Sulfitobacter sp.]
MRRWVIVLLIPALLWSGWWWLASGMVVRSVTAALEAQRAQGRIAEVGRLESAGFPLQLRTEVHDLALSDPGTSTGLVLPSLTLSAPTYWPGDATLMLPEDVITVTTPAGPYFLRLTDGRLELKLHPGSALALEAARLRSGNWQINGLSGNLLSAESLSAEITETDAPHNSYRLKLQSTALSPGEPLRAAAQIPTDLPDAFDAFSATLNLSFDAPLDRHALNDAPPRPTAAQLLDLEVAWGDIRITGQADLTFNAEGVPEGTFDMRIEQWKRLIDLAVAAGLAQQTADRARVILQAIANRGDDPETLTLPVRFQGGEMYFGTIQLGPAPHLR